MKKTKGKVEVCEWWKEPDRDYYTTDCFYRAEYLTIFNFCPFCGKKIKVKGE
jgi:hypothetical protein